jgi:hypothetical protein
LSKERTLVHGQERNGVDTAVGVELSQGMKSRDSHFVRAVAELLNERSCRASIAELAECARDSLTNLRYRVLDFAHERDDGAPISQACECAGDLYSDDGAGVVELAEQRRNGFFGGLAPEGRGRPGADAGVCVAERTSELGNGTRIGQGSRDVARSDPQPRVPFPEPRENDIRSRNDVFEHRRVRSRDSHLDVGVAEGAKHEGHRDARRE